MDNIIVKIINKSQHLNPEYSTPGAAGMDIKASLPEKNITIAPGKRALIPTGIYIQLPEGFECQVRPRSGLAAKHGITVLNTPGTIDSDYRGEIRIILINLGEEDFTINDGDRIAQLVVAQYSQVNWLPVASLDDSDRAEGGFGHTGGFGTNPNS